jgi:hypothetical protein
VSAVAGKGAVIRQTSLSRTRRTSSWPAAATSIASTFVLSKEANTFSFFVSPGSPSRFISTR